MEDILKQIENLTNKMPENRTIEIIALKAGEELGELNEAILVKGGHKKSKKYDEIEGITGEAVDVALCALSIALKNSDFSEVKETLLRKLAKWERTV